MLYNRLAPYNFGIHEIERNFLLLEIVFENKLLNIKPERPDLFPSKDDFSIVKKLIYDKIKKNEKFVSIAPGSVWQTKRWPSPHYKKLIEILRDHGIKAILIGGKEDNEICKKLTLSNTINLAGKVTLLQSAAAISISNAIVTNDSAPLHIASAMNTPTVAIFGSTTPYLGFGPLADKSIIIENNDIKCRPCGRHGKTKCKQEHYKCMKEITPDRVFNELLKIID